MNVLITGGRGGIGYSLIKKIAKVGHVVYVGCKTNEEVVSLSLRLDNDKVIAFPFCLNLLDEINDNIFNDRKIDVLILNAATNYGGDILTLDMVKFKEVIDVNILGNLNLIKIYLKYLIDKNKKGKIFLTSSLIAFYPLVYLSSYSASKLYLISLFNTLKLEVKYLNVDVKLSLILPGAYNTGFNDVMIDNISNNSLKNIKMKMYLKILFALLESVNIDKLTNKIAKEIEKDNPVYIISKPEIQKIFTKIYIIIKTLGV